VSQISHKNQNKSAIIDLDREPDKLRVYTKFTPFSAIRRDFFLEINDQRRKFPSNPPVDMGLMGLIVLFSDVAVKKSKRKIHSWARKEPLQPLQPPSFLIDRDMPFTGLSFRIESLD
jgi:hypothetical protein